MKLADFIPSLQTAKYVGLALIGLAVAGAVTFAVVTVSGWRDDSQRLALVEQQLVDAKAENKALANRYIGKLDGIAALIVLTDTRRAAVDGRITAAQAGVAAQVQDFLRRHANAPSNDPRCVEPQSVRDGLLDLFPAARNPGRGHGGGSEGGRGAATAPAVIPPAAVPGRQRAAGDRGAMGMPATGQRGGSFPARYAAGAAGAPGGSAAQRDEPALRAAGLGLAPAWFAIRRNITAAWALIGDAMLGAAWDDRRDA
jgi:hypothetical protein